SVCQPGRSFGVKSLQDIPHGDVYETNCCFPVAGRLEHCRLDTGSSPTDQPSRKCAPVPKGDQEAAKDVEQGKQETEQSNEESREVATEGDQKSKPSLQEVACQVPRISASSWSFSFFWIFDYSLYQRGCLAMRPAAITFKLRPTQRFAKTGTWRLLSSSGQPVACTIYRFITNPQ